MLRRSHALLASLLFCTTIRAFGGCPAPNTTGLRICFPSPGSAVSRAIFEFGANTGGESVTHFEVFDNGQKLDSFTSLPSALTDGAIHDGHHVVVARITDT